MPYPTYFLPARNLSSGRVRTSMARTRERRHKINYCARMRVNVHVIKIGVTTGSAQNTRRNSSRRMRFYTAIFTTALAWLLTYTLATGQNIDTDRPILREVSGLPNDSLFGYSLVLHQTIANPSSRDAALRGARYAIIIILQSHNQSGTH